MNRRGLLAAFAAAALSFGLYRATLLPGVDFGDTGSFQTMVGSPLITPRDGYPLYFAIGTAMLWLTKAEPAHALRSAANPSATPRTIQSSSGLFLGEVTNSSHRSRYCSEATDTN